MRITILPGVALTGALLIAAARVASAQALVLGTVYDSLVMRAEMRGATVTIVELNREATTDAFGRFRFDTVPAGRYRVTFFHPVLDSLDLAAPVVLLDVASAGTQSIRLATPSPGTAYARLCPGRRDPATGVALGRVRDVDDGRPIAGAVVNAEWNEWTIGGGRPGSRRIVRAVARTSAGGGYLLCGIPSDAAIDVRVALGTQGAGPVPVLPGERLLARRDFAISRTDPAARVLVRDSGRIVRSDSSAPAAGTATVTGTVHGPDGRPNGSAMLGVLGTLASARASDAGRFRLAGVPAGTRAMEVRSLGFTPTTVIVDVRTGGAVDTAVRLEKRPQTLATVSVVGQGEPADRTGFADRRKKGFGTFFTSEDFRKYQPFDIVSAVALAPSIQRNWTASGEVILMRGSGGGRCVPNIFVDDVQFQLYDDRSMGELNTFVRPDAVRGMEVYPGPLIPFRYDRRSTNDCGSVVIWTR